MPLNIMMRRADNKEKVLFSPLSEVKSFCLLDKTVSLVIGLIGMHFVCMYIRLYLFV